jgi:sarcosine oxidase subunit gamma
MSESIRKESPLVRFDLPAKAKAGGASNAAVTASERAFLGHINIRGNPDNEALLEAVKAVLGTALPLEPNTVAEAGDVTIYWLGPDEWLAVMPGEREHEIAEALRKALDQFFAAVTVVSGGQTVIVLEGPGVRQVLARGSTLDLHPRVFAPGQCAQSIFGKAPFLIRQVTGAPRFELIVRRSFSDYVWLYLNDAARDDGLVVA